MVAHDSSFTLDDSGDVSEWRDDTNRFPALSARDAVGKPAGRVLNALLDQLAGETGPRTRAVVRFAASRDGSATVIAIRDGTVPDDQDAHVEAAFESSAFEQSTAGLEIYDADLRVLRSNSAALAMRGRSAGQVLRRPVADLGSRLPLAPLLRQTLAGGEPAVHQQIDGHDGHGHQRIFAVTAFQLREERHIIGAGTVIHDVTDQTRAQAAARLLARAHEEIGTTLDAMRTARELATVTTREFADAVSVDLIDCVLRGEAAPAPPVGTDVPLRRAAFEAPGNRPGLYSVGKTSGFVSPTPYTQVMADLVRGFWTRGPRRRTG